MPDHETTVVDNPDKSRFEMAVPGGVAFAT